MNRKQKIEATTKGPSEKEEASAASGIAGVKPHIEIVLSLVVAAFGVAYGTGFVVVTTFLNDYGIREAGAEVFRLRYIYVGALCLACPAALVCIQQGLLSRHHATPSEDAASSIITFFRRLFAPVDNMPLATMAIVVNLIVVSYCVVAFSRPGLFASKQVMFDCLYLPIAATLCLRLIFGETNLWSKWLNAFRWLLVAVSVGVSVVILKEIDFVAMFRGGVQNYLILQALFLFFVHRFTKWRRLGTDSEARASRIVVRLMVLGSLFVVSILSFAHTVFNYIPAERGGGDFSQLSDCRICFADLSLTNLPSNLVLGEQGQPSYSVPVKIIEETGTDFYVAKSADRGGCPMTNVLNAAEVWRFGKYHPTVFQITRSAVKSIIVLNCEASQLQLSPPSRSFNLAPAVSTNIYPNPVTNPAPSLPTNPAPSPRPPGVGPTK